MQRTYHKLVSTRSTPLQREHETSDAVSQGTILVLTDGENAQPLLMPWLENNGYSVQQAATLDNALQYLAEAEYEPQIIIVYERSLQTSGDRTLARLHEASAIPVRIIMLADEGMILGSGVDQPDALLAWPWHEQEIMAHIQSQLRAQKTISELVESRSVLLGSSLLAGDMLRSTRNELLTQTTLHQELLQRVHTHIGALRDYLELEVRRLPLGIARDSMQGLLYRLRNMSALYDTMAILELEDTVDFCRLSTRIGQGIKAMYSPRSKLPLVVKGELILPSASASPLALVVNELVTNAYRHAFPGGSFGKITITCGREDRTAWCRVEDNGVGMPTPPNVAVGKISGTVLVQRLVRSSLGGTCIWQSISGGTTATVKFPIETA